MAAVDGLVRASRSRPCPLVARDAINRVLLTSLVPELGQPDTIVQPTGCWSELRHDGDQWATVVVGATPRDGQALSV